jgi:hypothetical protein
MHRPSGPKATKNPIPSDKVTHQGTTASKAYYVDTGHHKKLEEKDKSAPKRIYLFSKTKANQKQI